MEKILKATIADVLFCFQEHPGTDADTIINAGDGKLTGSSSVVKAQGKGFYGFKFGTSTSAEFSLFGTDYHVRHLNSIDLETLVPDKIVITNWLGLEDKNKMTGVQQRLQLLGYYNGLVDNKLSKETEQAILNFQADNKLRTDGIAGLQTCQKLDDIINSDDKSGKDYIIRKSLIRFNRAPTKDPKQSTGRPWATAPDPDDRGYAKFNTLGKSLSGPVLTMSRNTKFRIKLIRENISNDSQLMVESTDTNIVEVISPPLVPFPSGHKALLPKEKESIIELKAIKPGNIEIDIYFLSGSNQIKVGSIQVIVLSLITRLLRPYYVTIADATGIGATAPSDSKSDWEKVFDIANNTWWPYGIYFKILPWRDKTVNLSTAGRISKNPNLKDEFNTIINAKDAAGNSSETTVINLLIVKEIQDCIGVAYDALDSAWPNGIALSMNPEGEIAAGNDLAHELGHYLSLANCLDPGKYVHADDDPDSGHKKKDLWTIRKLMYSWNPHAINHNVGYGLKRRGSMVTVRNLVDKTDNECSNARKWARDPNFYKKP